MRSASLILVLFLACALAAPTLAYPLTLVDSSIFTYIGQVILDGGAPYRDAWDVKAPAVFFFYAAALLAGKFPLALRLSEAVWQLATAALLGLIASRLFPGRSVAPAAGLTYLLLYFSQDYWNLAQSDGLLVLPMALALWFLLRALGDDRNWDWGAAAAFLGVACLFKMTMGLFGIAMLAATVSQRSQFPGRLLARVTSLAAGFLLPFLACVLYFRHHAALRELLEALFIAGPSYAAKIHGHLNPAFIRESLSRPSRLPLYIGSLLGIGGVFSRWRRGSTNKTELLVLAWFGTALASLILHGTFVGYHYAPLFAPVAVLAAGVLPPALREVRQGAKLVPVAILVLAVLALPVPLKKIAGHATFIIGALRGSPPVDTWVELGDYIRLHTQANDRIYVWGTAVRLYLLAERKSSSRFLNGSYLTGLWDDLNFRPIFLREIREHPPVYFVVVRPSAGAGAFGWGAPDFPAELANFGALNRFVGAEYQIERREQEYELYRRRSGQSSLAPQGADVRVWPEPRPWISSHVSPLDTRRRAWHER